MIVEDGMSGQLGDGESEPQPGKTEKGQLQLVRSDNTIQEDEAFANADMADPSKEGVTNTSDQAVQESSLDDQGSLQKFFFVINFILIFLLVAMLGVWLRYHSQPNMLFIVIFSIFFTVGAGVLTIAWSLKPEDEKEKLRAKARGLLSSDRWLPVTLVVFLVLMLVVSRFEATLEVGSFKGVAEINIEAVGSNDQVVSRKKYPVPETCQNPDSEEKCQSSKFWLWSKNFPMELIAKARGLPNRYFTLNSWNVELINDRFFWEEPVILIVSTSSLRRNLGPDNRVVITFKTPDGKQSVDPIEVSGHKFKSIVIGPVDCNLKIPPDSLTAMESGYSEAEVTNWQTPNEHFSRRLFPGTQVEIRVEWRGKIGKSNLFPVSESDNLSIGEGKWQKNYPQWRIIDVKE